jgi:hypothetical protein
MDVDAREGRIDGNGYGDGARGEQSSQIGIELIWANCKQQAPMTKFDEECEPRERATKGGSCG